MEIDQIPHALGEVLVGPAVGDLDLAPGTVGVEDDEEVDGSVPAVLAIVAFKLAGLGGDSGS